jgi:hypothetical protein
MKEPTISTAGHRTDLGTLLQTHHRERFDQVLGHRRPGRHHENPFPLTNAQRHYRPYSQYLLYQRLSKQQTEAHIIARDAKGSNPKSKSTLALEKILE